MHRAERRRDGSLRAFIASLSGTALEYYDFAVYGSLAALVFGKLFFPSHDPLTGALQAFAAYGVGYAARPLGGILFGRLGDVIGRKKVLVATLLLVGIATFMVGLLPTYAQAGIVAPVMLVTLRLVQGIGVGGEWGGAVLLSSENAKRNARGFWASAAQIGPPVGTLMANGVLALLTTTMPEPTFLSWGWRIAFLLSALLVGFGLWIRARLEETPVFLALSKSERPTAPVTEVLQGHKRAVIASLLARLGPDVLYAMFAVFVLTYATEHLGLSRHQAVAAVALGSAIQALAVPISGWLSDLFGRRQVYLLGAVGAAVWSVAFFHFAHDSASATVGIVGGLVLQGVMYGPQAAFIAEQFPARLRYTGSALGYTLAGVVGGAIAPFAFTYLLATTGGGNAIGLYIVTAQILTLFGLALSRKVIDHTDQATSD
jgi:MFS family permease